MAEIEIYLPSDSGDISPIDGGTVALIILSQNLVIHIKFNWFDREWHSRLSDLSRVQGDSLSLSRRAKMATELAFKCHVFLNSYDVRNY